MDPRLLSLYEQELAYVREMGGEFADAFPKVAGQLGMNGTEIADPYVERLLEGFAFLAARVQLKLQARFPDFTQHLLELVYPHFLAPTPSMAIVQFLPDPAAGRLEKGYLIPRGTKLTSQLPPGAITHCEFRTAHDVRLWPVAITDVDYHGAAQSAALGLPARPGAKAMLRLRLRTTNGVSFNRLAIRSVTLHLTGPSGIGAAIAEQLLADVIGVIARPSARPVPWQEFIPVSALRQVGFAPEEALLPDMAQSFHGYRLLREHFALPQRSLFVEVGGLADAVALSDSGELELIFILKRANPRLERQLGTRNLALFATPAVNLFERHADRIQVSNRVSEHHIVVDRMRPMDVELHSVLQVDGEVKGSGKAVRFRPFYSIVADDDRFDQAAFYTLRRETRLLSARQKLAGSRTSYIGSETFITITGRDLSSIEMDLRQLSVRCLCSNRDLALFAPLGSATTDFSLEIGAPILAVRCLDAPTQPIPSAANGDVAWQLISHLSLNYLSITDMQGEGGNGAQALRELLRLHSSKDDAAVLRQIAGIQGISSQPVVRRIAGRGLSAVARGIEVVLRLDEEAFEGAGCFPLASVLGQFFAQYVSINGFAETVLWTEQRGEVMRWPAMAGLRAVA